MKKYKDLTAEERKALKAANEAATATFDAFRNAAQAAYIPPVVSSEELAKDHAATMRKIARRSRRSFAAGLEF